MLKFLAGGVTAVALLAAFGSKLGAVSDWLDGLNQKLMAKNAARHEARKAERES